MDVTGLDKTTLTELTLPTGDHHPIAQTSRRLPYSVWPETRELLDEWLQAKLRRPSSSQWAAPMLVIRKKTGKIRVVIDYRALNAILSTHEMQWPITLIDSCLDSMHAARDFTVMDVQSAYHQVPMADADIHKTAFVSPFELFEFLRATLDIKSMPGLWNKLADLIFLGLKWEILTVFFDDTHASSAEELSITFEMWGWSWIGSLLQG